MSTGAKLGSGELRMHLSGLSDWKSVPVCEQLPETAMLQSRHLRAARLTEQLHVPLPTRIRAL